MFTGFAALFFGMHGSGLQKGRPWPPAAFYVPLGLGLLHAAPAILTLAFAPSLMRPQLEVALVAFAAWILVEPIVAARLMLRMTAKP